MTGPHSRPGAARRRTPDEVTDAELSPPEGDLHFWAKVSALDTLRAHFRRKRRSVYVASELPFITPRSRASRPTYW